MPTLVDFVESVRQLDLGVEAESIREAIATILLELQGWLTSRVGKAISQPSTIRTDAKLTVFALRNVGDNIEAAVLALSAQSMAFRKALEVTDALLATAGPAAANGLSSVFSGAFKRRGLSRCRCRLRM